VRVTPYRFYF